MAPCRILLLGMAAGTAAAVAAALAAGQPLGDRGRPGHRRRRRMGVRHAAARRRGIAHFDSTLPTRLTVLASSLRAGHSLLQAVDHVAEEADDRMAAEWREVVRQTRLGIPVEDAIDDMAHRVANRDLQWISLVARVQHQVGRQHGGDVRHRRRDGPSALPAARPDAHAHGPGPHDARGF